MKKIYIGIIIIITISTLVFLGYNFRKSTGFIPDAIGAVASGGVSADSTGSINADPTQSNSGQTASNSYNNPTESSPNVSQSQGSNTGASSADKQAAEKKNKSIVDKMLPANVENKINSIAGNVSATDLLEVAKIVGGKLSLSEIAFLFNSAKAEYWETTSVEEIEKARNMLFSKLSDADLATLSQFGKKYGRSMTILKKDINVAVEKEKLMRSKGLIN